MGIAENEALIRRVYDQFNKGNYDIVDECFTDDFVRYRPGNKTDREGLKKFLVSMNHGFPDIERTIIDLVVAENRAALYFAWTGTDSWKYEGRTPTGKRIRVKEFYFIRFKDGKISEYRQYGNADAMRLQLGMGPPPEDSYWTLD